MDLFNVGSINRLIRLDALRTRNKGVNMNKIIATKQESPMTFEHAREHHIRNSLQALMFYTMFELPTPTQLDRLVIEVNIHMLKLDRHCDNVQSIAVNIVRERIESLMDIPREDLPTAMEWAYDSMWGLLHYLGGVQRT